MKKLALLLLLPALLATMASAQLHHAAGAMLDDSAYQVPRPRPQASVWHYVFKPVVSFKDYTPIPRDQGDCNSCVGWACAYETLTTVWAKSIGLVNKKIITDNAFNPMYLYYRVAADCSKTSNIITAITDMENYGVARNKDLPALVDQKTTVPADKLFKTYYYERIFEFHSDSSAIVNATRTTLNDGSPIVILGLIDAGMDNLTPQNCTWVPGAVKTGQEYHAMCVIGYDDLKKRFEIMNSWGTGWGNGGYFYVSYQGFAQMVHYAFQLMPGYNPGEINLIDISGDLKIEKSMKAAGAFIEVKPVLTGNYYVLDNQIKPGDIYRFQLIDLKLDRFTYLVGVGPNKKAVLLYSSKTHQAGGAELDSLSLKSNNVTVTPLTQKGSTRAKKGSYEYCVLYAVNQVTNIGDIITQANKGTGDRIDNINKALSGRLIPQNAINYESGDVKAKGMMGNGDIIPMYFKINIK